MSHYPGADPAHPPPPTEGGHQHGQVDVRVASEDPATNVISPLTSPPGSALDGNLNQSLGQSLSQTMGHLWVSQESPDSQLSASVTPQSPTVSPPNASRFPAIVCTDPGAIFHVTVTVPYALIYERTAGLIAFEERQSPGSSSGGGKVPRPQVCVAALTRSCLQGAACAHIHVSPEYCHSMRQVAEGLCCATHNDFLSRTLLKDPFFADKFRNKTITLVLRKRGIVKEVSPSDVMVTDGLEIWLNGIPIGEPALQLSHSLICEKHLQNHGGCPFMKQCKRIHLCRRHFSHVPRVCDPSPVYLAPDTTVPSRPSIQLPTVDRDKTASTTHVMSQPMALSQFSPAPIEHQFLPQPAMPVMIVQPGGVFAPQQDGSGVPFTPWQTHNTGSLRLVPVQPQPLPATGPVYVQQTGTMVSPPGPQPFVFPTGAKGSQGMDGNHPTTTAIFPGAPSQHPALAMQWPSDPRMAPPPQLASQTHPLFAPDGRLVFTSPQTGPTAPPK